MALKYANDYSQDAATKGQLWSYGGRDSNSLLAMLYALLQAWQGNDTEYGIDQQNKYIDMLLNQQEKQEDRQYSEDWRDNERAYNSAQAQLARLMATGMSRDAAMQLLGAGGAGSGGSSAAPVVSTLPSGLGSSAIDYANMKINDRNSWANIVLGSIQTAASLVNLGVSSNLAIKQASNVDLQTTISQKSMAATSMASDVVSSVNNAIQAGATISKEDTETPQALTKWINDNVEQYPILQSAQQYLATNGDNNPFFQPQLSTAFRDWHEQRTTPRMLSATLDGVIADNLLKGVQYDLVLAQANESYANTDLLIQEHANLMVEYQNLISTGEKIDAERRLIESQTELVDSQTESQGLQNNIVRPQAEAYKFKASDLSATYQMQIAMDLQKWSQMSSKEVMEDMKIKITQDYKYAAALATFNACSQTSLNAWSQNNTQLVQMALAFDKYHFGDILHSVAESLPTLTQDPVGYVWTQFSPWNPAGTKNNTRDMLLNSFLPNGRYVDLPTK